MFGLRQRIQGTETAILRIKEMSKLETMIQSLNTFATALIGVATTGILILFLPAIIELKRPLDAGPRLIRGNFAEILLSDLKIPIINVEDDWRLDRQSTMTVRGFFDFVPNLEV